MNLYPETAVWGAALIGAVCGYVIAFVTLNTGD